MIDTEQETACRRNEKPLTWNQADPQGTGGGSPMFAHVAAGTLDTARSKGVISLTKQVDSLGNNVYCFVLRSTPANVVATAERDSAGFGVPAVAVAGTAGMNSLPCDTSSSAAVIYGFAGTPMSPPSPASFFVAFNQ